MKKIALFLICILFLSSCEVQTGGCTDPAAYNYESYVDFDDGTCVYSCEDVFAVNYQQLETYPVCRYQADVVFWLDLAAAQYFTDNSISFLDVWVGTTYIGTMPTNVGFLDAVSCDDSDIEPVYFIYEWEDALSANLSWTIRDGSGQIWYDGTDLALANNCLSLGLTYKKLKEFNNLVD